MSEETAQVEDSVPVEKQPVLLPDGAVIIFRDEDGAVQIGGEDEMSGVDLVFLLETAKAKIVQHGIDHAVAVAKARISGLAG